MAWCDVMTVSLGPTCWHLISPHLASLITAGCPGKICNNLLSCPASLSWMKESKNANTNREIIRGLYLWFNLFCQFSDVIPSFGTHLTRKLFPVKAESYKFSFFQEGGRHTCYQEKFTRKLLSLSRIILNCSKIFQPEPNVPTKMNWDLGINKVSQFWDLARVGRQTCI